jgi:hypothetical protein
MASLLADLQDERLLDRMSCPPPIPANLIEKLNIIGKTPLRKEVGAKQHDVIRYLRRAFSFPFNVFRSPWGYSPFCEIELTIRTSCATLFAS